MKLPTFRDYKIAIIFLFLGAIATAVFFAAHNLHNLWVFKLDNDLGKLQVSIIKIQDKVDGYDKLSESWNKFKAETEEALDIIFKKPNRVIRAKMEEK